MWTSNEVVQKCIDSYAAGATAYALKSKVLVEALEEIICDWHLHISKPMVDKIRKSLDEYNNQ